MEKIKNFIQEYKTVIIIILLAILFLFVFLKFWNTEKFTEHMDSSLMMNALVGKNVYISCDILGEKKYLTLLPKEKCDNLNVKDCDNSIALLLSDKTENALLEVGKHPDLPKYTLRSQSKLTLSQNSNKLCFEDTNNTDLMYFETEFTENGLLFKFQNNYVGLCVNENSKCDNNIRVCLFPERQLAIPFRFEMTTPKKVETMETFENESFDLSGLSESFYSNGTLMSSIPGAGYINNNYHEY